ncbi:MAG: hypothetical protein H6811_06810 [Phycisphaeraceae bacterium]|nr:hypothetical protein [Phycisphaeraceae bacterium]
MPPNWQDLLQTLLCALYEVLGGACADLNWGGTGQAAIEAVILLFETRGLPSFSGQADVELFVHQLDVIENHLQLPTATLSKPLSDQLLHFISDVRHALNSA